MSEIGEGFDPSKEETDKKPPKKVLARPRRQSRSTNVHLAISAGILATTVGLGAANVYEKLTHLPKTPAGQEQTSNIPPNPLATQVNKVLDKKTSFPLPEKLAAKTPEFFYARFPAVNIKDLKKDPEKFREQVVRTEGYVKMVSYEAKKVNKFNYDPFFGSYTSGLPPGMTTGTKEVDETEIVYQLQTTPFSEIANQQSVDSIVLVQRVPGKHEIPQAIQPFLINREKLNADGTSDPEILNKKFEIGGEVWVSSRREPFMQVWSSSARALPTENIASAPVSTATK